MQRVGVLCSGGDAPGMNAAIRAVVRRGTGLGLEIFGIRNGYSGLMTDAVTRLTPVDVGNIIQLGGTVLGTSRCPEFLTPEGRAHAAGVLARHRIEALVVVGGDGSFRGAEAMGREHGVAMAGLPGTIDNDIAGFDSTIGFDSAVNTAVEAIDRLRDTADSLQRLFFVEVMGRTTGHIAAQVGIAGGAEEVLVPETPTDFRSLSRRLQRDLDRGKRSAIVVVAEGGETGGAFKIAEAVRYDIGYDSRVCVLGHIQRGGRPTARDRVLASRLGAAAVEALLNGQRGIALGEQGGQVVTVTLLRTYDQPKSLDQALIQLARNLAEYPADAAGTGRA